MPKHQPAHHELHDDGLTAYGSEPRARAWLRKEKSGGLLLIVGAVLALAWANSPWSDSYADLAGTVVGPSALHLDLSLATWAADGLLAIFFFVVGVELKAEFVTGSLRHPRKAAVPMVAAVGGMVVPALVFTVVVAVAGGDGLRGWAIPTATDIAFALAVLAVVAPDLPSGLRIFLLTLAVVDDLLAITIIAVFYTTDVAPLALLGAAVAIGVFGLLVQRRQAHWWLLLPVALVAWALMHESGVHATVAGVLLGFTVPALAWDREESALTSRLEHAVRPWSQGLALPVFAFFAAGVSIADAGGLAALATDPVAVGVALGLVVGKIVGVWGTVLLVTAATPLELDDGVTVRGLLGIAMLAGIGFTVSLLISELAFGAGSEHADHAKVAVLVASVVAAVAATLVLRHDQGTVIPVEGPA